MTRNRASAKAAGTRAERAVADYLRDQLQDDRIDRMARRGRSDRGDIAGVRAWGQRVVIEVKDVAKLALGTWTREAEIERMNDDALVGIVVHKRRGTTNVGDWYVTTTMTDLVALMTGERDD